MNKLEYMNLHLANLNVFYRKLQNFHWYVTGKNFFTIHEKLEELYDELSEKIDELAERILMVDGKPYGSLKKYLEITKISERDESYICSEEIMKELLNDYSLLLDESKKIKELADEDSDYGTSAMIDEYISSYEKTLWMIKSYLK